MVDYKTQVEILKRDIVKLKADKDFVWSLWKRLQLSSPDLTDAVSLITQREKEKLDLREHEIQEEIKEKDKKLYDLTKVVIEKNTEIETLKNSNKTIFDRAQKLETQCADVTNKASKLNELLTNKCDHSNDQRELVTAYERERIELTGVISRLQAQIASLNERNSSLQLCVDATKTELRLERNSLERLRQESSLHVPTGTSQGRDVQDKTMFREHVGHGGGHREDLERGRTSLDQIESGGRYSGDSGRREIVIESSETGGGYYGDTDRGGSQSEHEESYPGQSESRDLHRKVERLATHVSQLADCVDTARLRGAARACSTPPGRRSNSADRAAKQRMSQKLHFLEMKLTKTESLLNEERKTAGAASEYLEKANQRARMHQASVKQLRTELKDVRAVRDQLQAHVAQLEADVVKQEKGRSKTEAEMGRLRENSINDALRIQQLVDALTAARHELVETKIDVDQYRQQEESTRNEVDRLKEMMHQIESDRQAAFDKTRCHGNAEKKTRQVSQLPRRHCVARTKRSIKCPRSIKCRKTRNMSAILNHFENTDSSIGTTGESPKEDEWEDVDTEQEDGQFRSEYSATDRSGRSGGRSDQSVGSRIARVAAINQCSEHGVTRHHRTREARRNHVSRIQRAQERSSVEEHEAKVAKNRAASLQQQLKSVVESRDSLRNQLTSSQSQVDNLHQDLQQVKSRCNRLMDAYKKLSSRCQILLGERRSYLGTTDTNFCIENAAKESCLDTDEFGSDILNSCQGNENFVLRELQQELGRRNADLLQARDKISRLGRENTCKKEIIDDLRGKLKLLEEAKGRDKSCQENRDRKTRELEESHLKMKTQLDSLHVRLAVVLNERRRFEQESADLQARLDGAESKLGDLRQSKHLLETRLAQLDETQERKITDIVTRSGSALDDAQFQIEHLKTRGSKYESLIIGVAKDFYQKIREIRRLIEFGSKRGIDNHNNVDKKTKSSDTLTGYEFARNKAADILSLSTTEIDSLLRGATELISDSKGKFQTNNSALEDYSDFRSKCRQAFKNKHFDQIIQSLFAEKLEELVELVAPMSCDSGCVSSS